MSIPSKEDALSVAIENVAIDAAKYERKIEAMLMCWDGQTELRLDVPAFDMYLVDHLVKSLRGQGFTARSSQRSNRDWWVFFK